MAKIYLLRHGEVSGPAALYGHTDVAVSAEVNAAICRLLAGHTFNISRIFCSPLQRCLRLAQLLTAHYHCALSEDSRLKEMNFGCYDGVAFDELYQEHKAWQALELFWQNPVQHPLPQAELLTGFSFRVIQAWQQIVQSLARECVDSEYLVVCHGGVIRMILAHLLNVDYRNPDWYTQLSIANGSLTTIDYQQSKCRVSSIAKSLLINHDNNNEESNDDFIFSATALVGKNLEMK
ncbi:alpha-ribazole-5'-phosphate phosphatase [Thalassotalea insulae]|uniref:Alpha-ribazole-5'-phosphate phosphatase n=1 Tax=Thalassotalea insulae TaxID=2056778 RepID=A0ABQ6GUA6_9GAMM|nr:alpha-ribazole phosphatase family protein [Thalassotalea insulae]GLX79244.1 alpha-ribazole-5'-phosphate phosphatase [Thalassotalea insulae]